MWLIVFPSFEVAAATKHVVFKAPQLRKPMAVDAYQGGWCKWKVAEGFDKDRKTKMFTDNIQSLHKEAGEKQFWKIHQRHMHILPIWWAAK